MLYAFLMGGISSLAFAPLHWIPCFFIGFFLFFRYLQKHPSKAFKLGWFFGWGHFAVGLYWISYAFGVDIARFWWMVPFAVLGLPAFLALYIGAATWATVRTYLHPLSFAFFWGLAELARAYLLTGFPWNLVGYIWANCDAISQSAAYIGPYLLGVLTVWAALSHKNLLRGSLLFLALYGLGTLRLMTSPTPTPLMLRIVQPNIPQKEKWQPAFRIKNVRKLVDLSQGPGPSLLIWPETAIPYIYKTDEPFFFHGLAHQLPSPLITGIITQDQGTFYNSLIHLSKEGTVIESYYKSHLVPFGEYVPFRAVIQSIFPKIQKITAGPYDFSPGTGLRSLLSAHPFSPLICYEVIFPGHVTDPSRPRWLVNLTNDGWYGTSAGPYQHLVTAKFRAIEEGLPLVRAANTGISAVFDPWGRLSGQIPLNTEGSLDFFLPQDLPSSPPYGRWGNTITLVGLLFLLFGVLLKRQYRIYLSPTRRLN